jgi:hypothetical protein
MTFEEQAGSPTTLPALLGVDAEGVDEPFVIGEQIVRPLRGIDSDNRRHDRTCLARAHSAATVSGARCT